MVDHPDQQSIRIKKDLSVLGIPVRIATMAEIVRELEEVLASEGRMRVVTLNPEMVMRSRWDPELRQSLHTAGLIVPDGFGVVFAMRRAGFKDQPRIAGVDLVEELLKVEWGQGLRLFLLGGEPGVAEEAARRLKRTYPGVRVVGAAHGYLSPDEEERVVEIVNRSAPHLLLVGMGLPKQEIWLARHWERLKASIGIGIGGGIDLWAGRSKRAPRMMRRVGLEWLYRTVCEPKRVFRLAVLPKYLWLVMRSSKKPKEER